MGPVATRAACAAALVTGLSAGTAIGFAAGLAATAVSDTIHPPELTDPPVITPVKWDRLYSRARLTGPLAVSRHPIARPAVYDGVALYRAPDADTAWPDHWMIEDRHGDHWGLYEVFDLIPVDDHPRDTTPGEEITPGAGATVPVPLPGGAWLMGAALVVLTFLKWRT